MKIPESLRSNIFPKSNRNNLLIKSMVSIIIIILIIFFFIKNFDIGKVVSIITNNTNIQIFLLAFFIYYLTFITKTLRWKILLDSINIREKFSHVLYAMFSCFFFNSILPFRSGDFYRIYLLKRGRSQPMSKVAGTVFIEKMFDVFFIFLFLLTSVFLLFNQEEFTNTINNILLGSFFLALTFIIIILIVLLFGYKRFNFIPNRINEIIKNFRGALKLCTNPITTISVLFITLIEWSLIFLFFYLLAYSLGVQLTVTFVIFIVVAENLLATIPLSPAGLGFVELGVVGILIFLGVEKNLSLSISLLDRIVTFWFQILLGLIVFLIVRVEKIFS